MFQAWKNELLRAPEGAAGAGADAAAGAGGDVAAVAAAAAAAAAGGAAPKWFEDPGYDTETRDWLKAKGHEIDDHKAVLPKLIKSNREAEKLIGKPADSIIDRPAKDQPVSAWLKANAEALGLPKEEAGYEAKAPDTWPKDLPWDAALEAKARKIAFDAGIPPEVHRAYVGLQAEAMLALDKASKDGMEAAKTTMMAELQRDFGRELDGKLLQARQAADVFAEAAKLGADQKTAVMQALADKTGDAGMIRLFAAIGAAMGDDRAVGIGLGGALQLTPAEAKVAFDQFNSPEGDYGKAFLAGDHAKMAELRPRRDQLSRLAAPPKKP